MGKVLSKVLALALVANSYGFAGAYASVLTFDGFTGVVPDAYGDRIVATTDVGTGYQYGMGNGFTPNIVVEYSNNTASPFSVWSVGYGSLSNALGHQSYTVEGEIVLRPDPGVSVVLNSFDVAAWISDFNGQVVVANEAGTVLFDSGSVLLSSATFSTFPTGGPIVSSTALRIQLTYYGDLGLDNVNFDQIGSVCGGMILSGCKAPGKSLLLLKNNTTDDTKDKLTWKWLKGAETSMQDLGTPTGTTNYSLCLYAGANSAPVYLPAGSNWQMAGAKGFKFTDKSGTPDGAQKAILKSGAAGKAKMLVKGKGVNLPDTLVPELPLPVTVQLVNDGNSACFEATYNAAIKNDAKQFKAKTP